MRFVLMTASLMIVSLLIFQGYSNGVGGENNDLVGDPLQKASDVSQLVQEASYNQRQALEKQVQ